MGKVKIYAEKTVYFTVDIDYEELAEMAGPGLPAEDQLTAAGSPVPAGGWVTDEVRDYVDGQGYETDSSATEIIEIGGM